MRRNNTPNPSSQPPLPTPPRPNPPKLLTNISPLRVLLRQGLKKNSFLNSFNLLVNFVVNKVTVLRVRNDSNVFIWNYWHVFLIRSGKEFCQGLVANTLRRIGYENVDMSLHSWDTQFFLFGHLCDIQPFICVNSDFWLIHLT